MDPRERQFGGKSMKDCKQVAHIDAAEMFRFCRRAGIQFNLPCSAMQRNVIYKFHKTLLPHIAGIPVHYATFMHFDSFSKYFYEKLLVDVGTIVNPSRAVSRQSRVAAGGEEEMKLGRKKQKEREIWRHCHEGNNKN